MNAVVKVDFSQAVEPYDPFAPQLFPAIPTRQAIFALEDAIRSFPEEQREGFDNIHNFCPGVYARTIYMKAGLVLTSKIHMTQHFFMVSKGSCTVVNSHGEKELIVAPYLGVTMPGTKRALHIHEDCIWTTFHATTLTDLEEIEKQIMAENFDRFDAENSL